MPRIHLWCPSLSTDEGGIEAYSFNFTRALMQIAGEKNVTVLVRNQTRAEARAALGTGVRSFATGALPRLLWTVGFAFTIMARAFLDRPDLIITTHLNFSPFASLLQRWTNIPYWVSLHGYESWHVMRASQQKAVVNANRLLPVSGFTRDRVTTAYSIPIEKMRVLHDTFDPARFSIGPKPEHLLGRLGLTPDVPVILTVGRLSAAERYKGHDRIIRALPLVRVELPEVKYLIVGGGDDRPRLEALAEEEKVTEAVLFAGRVPHQELSDYYRLCDLFAMPSTGEGFGIVFLEALATGKPVLAGNRDGSVDALRGGELGVLVDPEDEQALGNAMISLLQRTHSHPLATRPEELRDRAVRAFGPEPFQQTVTQLLAEKM